MARHVASVVVWPIQLASLFVRSLRASLLPGYRDPLTPARRGQSITVHVLVWRLQIVCCGRGCRTDGAAGGRRSTSFSRRLYSPGIGLAFAWSGRGRVDIAPGAQAIASDKRGLIREMPTRTRSGTVLTRDRVPTAPRVVATTRLGGLHHHYQLEPVAAWVLAGYSGCAVRPGRQRPGDAFGFGADRERGIYEFQRW